MFPPVQLTMPIADKYEFVLGSKKTEKTIVEKFRAEPRVVLDVSSQQPLELTVTRSAVSLLKGIAEVCLLPWMYSVQFFSVISH